MQPTDDADQSPSEMTPSQSHAASVELPYNIVDVIVEFSDSEWRNGIALNKAADAVMRKASLHFSSMGYQELDRGALKVQLIKQLSALIEESEPDSQVVKEEVAAALKSYYDEEGKRIAVRWRSRIGVAADGITLISFGMSLGGFALGVLAEIIRGSSRTIHTDSNAPLAPPWPITGLAWDWVVERRKVAGAAFLVLLAPDVADDVRLPSSIVFDLSYKDQHEKGTTIELWKRAGRFTNFPSPGIVFPFLTEELTSLEPPFRAKLTVIGTTRGQGKPIYWQQDVTLPFGYKKGLRPRTSATIPVPNDKASWVLSVSQARMLTGGPTRMVT